MEMPTMDWRDEMFKMLVAFERQAIHSLGNIKLALNLSGKSINANFKQYFLQVSNARLEEAYKHFEINSQIEEEPNVRNMFGASSFNWNENGSQMETKESIRKIDYIEIDDSSDEEHTNISPKMLEPTSVESIRNFTMQRPTTATITDGESEQLKLKKRYNCQLCEYSSEKRWNLNTHMRTHTGEKPYRCDICHKEFARADILKRHKVTHIIQIPFHCRGCFSGFSQKAEKDAHEKVCKMRRYECHICKKYVSVHKNKLKQHIRVHNKI
ncbi:zinc finger protein 723-like [Contarinia nasturtii]|uniref:zinc finger protein 723-like n=1 Tax=Contarinia nasturtii TaxID=265458 RepID=UPI0012D3790E|nr:zinc finger protein 723-like [Contarinia nasturtii]